MLFDLNPALRFFHFFFFPGDTDTITEEEACMNVWMTPSKNKINKIKKRASPLLFGGLREDDRERTFREGLPVL